MITKDLRGLFPPEVFARVSCGSFCIGAKAWSLVILEQAFYFSLILPGADSFFVFALYFISGPFCAIKFAVKI